MNAREYYDTIRQDREAWAAQFTTCMNCGTKASWLPLETHEIERKSHAPRSWAHRCNYLRLCSTNGCHNAVDQRTHAAQLRLKRDKDPENYDLQAWLRLSDPELKAPERVTEQDINGGD